MPSDAQYRHSMACCNPDLSIMTFSHFQGDKDQETIMPVSLYIFLKNTHEAFPFLLEKQCSIWFHFHKTVSRRGRNHKFVWMIYFVVLFALKQPCMMGNVGIISSAHKKETLSLLGMKYCENGGSGDGRRKDLVLLCSLKIFCLKRLSSCVLRTQGLWLFDKYFHLTKLIHFRV